MGPAAWRLRMAPSGRLFCSKPFQWFEVFQGEEIGEIYMCCPSWLETPIGHLQRQSVEEIWNGEVARKIRRSVLDGSFSYCSLVRCPYLQSVTGPVQRVEDVTDEEMLQVIREELTVLPHGPRSINLSYDRSCNLACPSCRSEVIVETDRKREILAVQDRIRSDALRDARLLYITGSGDPFASPFFRSFLQTLKRAEVPELQEIFLHTNALLWTERMWNTIPEEIRALIRSTEISIDAASPATYSINRRGGNFERLLRNLDFIGGLRREDQLRSVRISMVVQENNFTEMADFVRLGQRFDLDSVFFTQLVNWGTYSEPEFRQRAVHLPEHPRHGEFIEALRDETFDGPIVHMGNLTTVREVGA